MLRQAGPAHRGFLGMWTFVRYEECSALLRDPGWARTSSAPASTTPSSPPPRATRPFLGLGLEGGTKPSSSPIRRSTPGCALWWDPPSALR
ncbi:hypothetical protein NKH18_12690 [Streptomyces sp. M10(2022)]